MDTYILPLTLNLSLDLSFGGCQPKSSPNVTMASACFGTGAVPSPPAELFIPSVLFLDEGPL